MSFKTTYILFGVLLIELAAFGWLLTYKKTVDSEDFLFPTLNLRAKPVKIGDIARVEVEQFRDRSGGQREEKLVFVRAGNDWRLENPSVRVEASTITAIIQGLIAARLEPNADVTNNLAQFGLEPPAGRVTLIAGEGDQHWVLTVGNESPGLNNAVVYVTSSDRDGGKQVLAVRRDLLEAFLKPGRELGEADIAKAPSPPIFRSMNDYRAKALLGDSPLDLLTLDLQESRHPKLAFAKDRQSGHWRFTEPAGYGEVEEGGIGSPEDKKGPEGIRGLLDAVTGLRVGSNDDFKDNHASAARLAELGLANDKPATLQIGVERYAGGYLAPGGEDKNPKVSDDLLIGKKDGDKYYARLKKEDYVVLVPAKQVQTILDVLDHPEGLRNRDLVDVSQLSVDAIDIKAGDRVLKLRTAGQRQPWRLYDGGKGVDAGPDAVPLLLGVLTTKRLVKEFPKKMTDAETGLDKPQAVVSIWTNGLDSHDLKPDAEPKLKDETHPTVQLTFGKTFTTGKDKKEELVYVRRKTASDETLVAVPTKPEKAAPLLETVLRPRLAYLDPKLPGFNADRARKLIRVVREAGREETWELERGEAKVGAHFGWTIKQPTAWAGRPVSPNAIQADLLQTLHLLRPAQLVAEKVTDADLKKNTAWGLERPAVQLTLTLQVGDKGTEEWAYQFGNKVEKATDRPKEGEWYYGRLKAKEEDRGLVFVVRGEDIKSLKADVRDLTVLTFDPADVKFVRLIGWAKDGKTTQVVFQQDKDGRWTAKEGAPQGARSDRVGELVSALVNLHADKFVEGKPDNKEYKLDPKDGALQVQLEMTGGKPITLTLGAPGEKNTYYATSSTLPPGQVFAVSQEVFRPVRQGPAYLSK
jgi:hypothetical protein